MSPSCRWSWSKSTKTSSKDCPWRSWSSYRKPWKGRSVRTAITVLPLPPWSQTLENWTTGLPPVRRWKAITRAKSLILLCDCSCQAFGTCMASQAPSDSLWLQRSLPRASSRETSLAYNPCQKESSRRIHAHVPTPRLHVRRGTNCRSTSRECMYVGFLFSFQ